MEIYIVSVNRAPEILRESMEGAEALADLLNITVSPALFFDNYNNLLSILEKNAKRSLPRDFLKILRKDIRRLESQEQKYCTALLHRCQKRLWRKLKESSSRREKLQYIEDFSVQFSEFLFRLSDKNREYLARILERAIDRI